ncbi:MAG: hypothetical protein WBA98_11080 [Gordonia sp. (in: high G+C Gram-positive bacteria)]|uniref:hypothetical protein n=1 Tax=Gordonia sp. (in: high G+C Gram-positive bacteria) TaxID=84139 RepID=UPI003C75CDBF
MSGVVSVRADGSISWRADTAVVLGPVPFEVNGVLLTVDGAFPDVVVDLAAPSSTALAATAQWFADPTVISQLAAAADGDIVSTPVLAEALSVAAGVRVVDAIHLGDLDEGVVLLDHAGGALAAGDAESATELYALSSAVAERLVEQFTLESITGPRVERLAEIVAAAPPGSISDATRQRITRDLTPLLSRHDAEWVQILGAEQGSNLFYNTIDSLHLGLAEVRLAFPVDLRVLPPRLLKFVGVEVPELQVETIKPAVIEVAADIRDDANTDSVETLSVFAVAAEASTGDLLAYAPTTVVDGRIVAELDVGDAPIDSLRCSLVGSGTNLEALRLDPVGAALTRIDRYCRYAWTQRRVAGALQANTGISSRDVFLTETQERADAAHREARDAAESAVALTRQLVRRSRGSANANDLAAYLDALVRFADTTGAPPVIVGPFAPTLAELVLAGDT